MSIITKSTKNGVLIAYTIKQGENVNKVIIRDSNSKATIKTFKITSLTNASSSNQIYIGNKLDILKYEGDDIHSSYIKVLVNHQLTWESQPYLEACFLYEVKKNHSLKQYFDCLTWKVQDHLEGVLKIYFFHCVSRG